MGVWTFIDFCFVLFVGYFWCRITCDLRVGWSLIPPSVLQPCGPLQTVNTARMSDQSFTTNKVLTCTLEIWLSKKHKLPWSTLLLRNCIFVLLHQHEVYIVHLLPVPVSNLHFSVFFKMLVYSFLLYRYNMIFFHNFNLLLSPLSCLMYYGFKTHCNVIAI